jgi:Na+/proline symporter
MVYAISIIIQGTLGLPLWQSLILIGVVTVIYSLQGGMSAVVYGDAVQMLLIVIGTLVCLGFGLHFTGGLSNAIALTDAARLQTLNMDSFGFDGDGFGLLPMLIGGFFLYASYYGCDQSEAQRSLSAQNQTDLKKMILAAALMRFPITLLYCTTGLVIGSFALSTPEFLSLIPQDKPDWMMPIFIVNYLPTGVVGVLLVAILAAAMSSLSSAINSLSAVSLEDFLRLTKKKLSERQYLIGARLTGIFWGLVTLTLSFFAGDIAPTVIEAINKVGSLFYGPILACFIIAIYSRKSQALAVNVGILVGVVTNLILWLFFENIFWFWWNAIGFVMTSTMCVLVSRFTRHLNHLEKRAISIKTPISLVNIILLLTWVAVIFAVCLWIMTSNN